MRTFDYRNLPNSLFERESGVLNTRLYEDRGRLQVLEQQYGAELQALVEKAHLENTDASTRIEGIYIGTQRTRELIDGATPDNDVESQVVGYSDALRLIEQDADGLNLSSGTVVRLFETLYGARDFGRKSRYRRKDYIYTQLDGHMQAVPVSPVPAFETPLVFGGACDGLAEAFDAQSCSPLILTAVFTVDFLCIRPFEEGNGRVARLFARLLLQKAGFDIPRFFSVDRLIELDAAGYYDALNACVQGWEQGANDYEPFVVYWLGMLHRAYQQLFERIELQADAGGSKTRRVELYLENATGRVTKHEILEQFSDISVSTVENVLGSLVREGRVRKVGGGRSTGYEWVG